MIKVLLINTYPASMHSDQTLSFPISEFSFLHYAPNRKLGDGKPLRLIKRPLRKLRGFHLRVSRFECSAEWKTRSWRISEVDQSTSEFDQNASEKNSEVFIFEFSVWGTVQNGKLGVEKPGKNILRGFRVFRELSCSFRPHRRFRLLSLQE